MKAAVYARVSSEEQVKGTSLDLQVKEITQKLKSKGYSVPKSYVFRESISGADPDPPLLRQVLALVRQGVIKAVGMYDPDRLARNLGKQIAVAEAFEKAGVSLLFATTEFNATPEGKLFFNMRGAFSEYEREKIRSRTVENRDAAARLGFWPSSKHPFGYAIQKVQDGSGRARNKLVPGKKDDVVLAKAIFERFLQGDSIRAVVRWLRAKRNGPTGGTWGKTTVHRLLENPAYKGEAHFKRYIVTDGKMRSRDEAEHIIVPVEAIVPLETWEAVQRRLRDNRQHLRNTAKHPYLLAGLVFCSACSKRMGAAPMHGVPYYRCRNKDTLRGRVCSMRTVNAAQLDQEAWDHIVSKFGAGSAGFGALVEGASGLSSRRQIAEEVREVEKRLAYLGKKERHLIGQISEPGFSPEQYAQLKKGLQGTRDEKAARQSDLARFEAQLKQKRDLKGLVHAAERMRKRLAKRLTFAEKREVVRAIVTEARVEPGRVRLKYHLRLTPEAARVLAGPGSSPTTGG